MTLRLAARCSGERKLNIIKPLSKTAELNATWTQPLLAVKHTLRLSKGSRRGVHLEQLTARVSCQLLQSADGLHHVSICGQKRKGGSRH